MTKRSTILVMASLATLLAHFAPAPVARADIYQWEYINPANPASGKQPSATLTPDGAGANAAPGTNLSNRNLTMAYLIDANVATNAFNNEYGYVVSYVASNLTAVNLSQADLTNANFRGFLGYNENEQLTLYPGADLTDANLFQANATNADFFRATLTGANLNQADLTNANFYVAAMTNANLSQANLTNANFADATLTGTNFTNAEVRGAKFSGRNLTTAQLYTTASYQAHDLSGIGLAYNDLTGWNFAGQNLTSATFNGATLTSANLTGAEVRGANFFRDCCGTGITAAQLYSTASYQAHDLSGISLGFNDLAGLNFAGQNLTSASFRGSSDSDGGAAYTNLSGANFSGADARGADFYDATLSGANLSQANLQNANFSGDWIYHGFTDLANANLSGADAQGAGFYLAALSGANFTDADVRGADFFFSGFTAAQLYSTASYKAHDLSGIKLNGNLASLNLAGQNLTNADFSPAGGGANLTGANLSGADARGASFYAATLTGTNTSNLIRPDGHVAGLNLTSGRLLVVRDYDGNSAGTLLPIVVEQHLAMDATGTLRLVFDADPWGSTISFAAGIPATRGGTLDLTFAPEVNLATQIGRTIDLFDWTGVTPTGTFTVSSPYTWNLTNLNTTGEVTLVAAPTMPGDFNHDGTVDAADYVVWRKNYGTLTSYNAWRTHFGQPAGSGTGASANAAVPEPTTLVLVLAGTVALLSRRHVTAV